MEYVRLGNSDLNVSRICLGCMGFGDASIGQHSWTIGEEPTREIIRRSLDLGVNFFDTAIAYQLGTSEQFVGRALKDMSRREDVVVATKFLPRTEEEIANGINGRQHVMNSIDSSLQHLGMDYVDLYIYHIWDYKTPAEEILEGMNEAVRALDVRLTADDIRYLEEPYVPHNLSGVMAVNKPAMSEEPVWVTAAKNK